MNKIMDTFGIEVKIKEIKEEPLYAYDPIRHQCHSGKILKKILDDFPDDAIKTLGITNQDLCTPILSYVFGEAQLSGKAAVVSTKRLKQEFYGLTRDDEIFLNRFIKEIIHEFGHTFGLVHCAQKNCVMSLSTNIFKVSEKSCNFCDACQEMIKNKIKGEN